MPMHVLSGKFRPSGDPFGAQVYRHTRMCGNTVGFRRLHGDSISWGVFGAAQGLGKTLQGIALLWTMLQSGHELLGGTPIAKRIIIVCPTSLVNNWCILSPTSRIQGLRSFTMAPQSITSVLTLAIGPWHSVLQSCASIYFMLIGGGRLNVANPGHMGGHALML